MEMTLFLNACHDFMMWSSEVFGRALQLSLKGLGHQKSLTDLLVV